MKVALIHDWLLGMRGGERCLEVLCQMFPGADIFTAFYQPGRVSKEISRHQIFVSSLNKLPQCSNYYRYLLPLYPFAARTLARSLGKQFVAQRYDMVISVSHCLAKNVAMPRGVFHLCYCLTPMRYIWDMYGSYFAQHPFEPLIARVAGRLREWDRQCAADVDQFVAISDFVRQRISRVYGRDAEVIYPPVRTEWIKPRRDSDAGAGFLCVSALVPYKNVETIIGAFNGLGHKLTVVGDGPLRKKLKMAAGSNILFRSKVSDSELAELYKNCRALVFGAEEDFGMVPVEAQAAGCPVICYGRGGVLETVRAGGDAPTGVFVKEPTVAAFQKGVLEFIDRQGDFTVHNSVQQAGEFSLARFQNDLMGLLGRLGFYHGDDRIQQAAAG